MVMVTAAVVVVVVVVVQKVVLPSVAGPPTGATGQVVEMERASGPSIKDGRISRECVLP